MANSARIDELRKKFDENPRRYFAPLANEYRKSGDLPQAVFILEEYLPQQPGHISGHIVYGQTLFELGRDEEAKRVFETALSLDPENLIALRHLGHISRQAGDFDAARVWYQRLLEADPRDAEIEQLLGSLDSAAQAQAASMGPPAAAVVPPSAPPSVADADDASLQIEHVVEQAPPGTAPRASTHPLAPPPLPMTPEPPPAAATESEGGERSIPVSAMEPPPLSPAPAGQSQLHADASDELLDLNDFSFDFPSSTSALAVDVASPTPPAPPHPIVEEIAAATAQTGGEQSPVEPQIESGEAWDGHFPAIAEGANEPVVELSAPAPEVSAEMDPIPVDVPVGFEPFSGLEPTVAAESEEKNVGGLETYTFESPEGPVADQSEDVGSFYMMDPTYATPPEPVEPATGFESNEEEFVAETSTEATQLEGTRVEETAVEETGLEETGLEATPVEAAAVEAEVTETPDIAVQPSPSPPDESDAFATETMAQLYLTQGHLESALGIYRTLAAKQPADEGLRRQIEEIEDRVQRRRREPTPPAPMRATPVESAAAEAVAAGATEESVPVEGPIEGPTIREFLLGILRRGGNSDRNSDSGSIDGLFGGGVALDDDLAAADTLAQAFAPEPVADPMSGQPTRAATSELSLDSVFRQPTAAHAGDRSSDGFSFDQFFASDAGDETGTSAATPGDPEDIEQFNAWLNGLKKS